MTRRENFISYVKVGSGPICSPQIGASAGFDTKLAGKEWTSATTVEDTLSALEKFDIVPLLLTGLPDLGGCDERLAWSETSVEWESANKVFRDYVLDTPLGSLSRRTIEEKFNSGFAVKSPVESADDLPKLEYYIDVALACDLSNVENETRRIVDLIDGRAAYCVQWPVQPYELLCFPSTVDTVMIFHDNPEYARRLMDKILLLNQRLMKAVSNGGADFIFLGGPGSEMISPAYYRDYIIPYSQQASSIAHSCGLLVYSHICSPIEPFLSLGFYNQMGIDLFETLSPPPVGNVDDLRKAMDNIDPYICTRGNIGLDCLVDGTQDNIKEQAYNVLCATAGRKHMLAASDYLFYQVPVENVQAMVDAVAEFTR